MRCLIACEYSGRVREAFRRLGHDAWSCDLLPAEDGSKFHMQGDVLGILSGLPPQYDRNDQIEWFRTTDAMRWLKDQQPLKSGKPVGAERRRLLAESIEFFEALWNAPVPRICIENPRSFLLPIPATQYIQPWQFGHGEVKTTGLWLKGLPKLVATNEVSGREAKVHKASPGPDRWKDRSRTYEGIADAMADQWGGYVDAVTLAEAA